MAVVDEKVRAQAFTVSTDLSPEQLREAGQRAIAVSKRAMTSAVHEDRVSDHAISYKVKGPGGLVTQMAFAVTWDDNDDGTRKVSLKIGEYMTARTTVLFIPVTPKRVPALGSLERFSAQLRQDLMQAAHSA